MVWPIFPTISDSVLFDIGTDRLEKIYSNSDIKFSSIVNYNSQIWLGSELGFGYLNNSKFESKEIFFLFKNVFIILPITI